jgi:hypothetical protein
MLAKKSVKNQITQGGRQPVSRYFEVSAEEDAIVLRPLRRSLAGEVRAKLARLGVREEDVADAIAWARKRR